MRPVPAAPNRAPSRVPRLTVTVSFSLAHTHLVGQNLSPYSLSTPTKYRGWLRSILAHVAAQRQVMPLPMVKEGGQQNYVYRYLVSSSSPPAHKALARLNVVGYWFGGPVLGYAILENLLGDEELARFYGLFQKSGIAVVSVDVKGVRCQQYPQGVRDDVSGSAVANPHQVIVCQVPREINVTFTTLPHPLDMVNAPEQAWNGRVAGKPFVEGIRILVEELEKALKAGEIEPWRLSPFPGRSKNPVEEVTVKVKVEESTVPSPNQQQLQEWNQKTAKIAATLAQKLREPQQQRNGRYRNGGGWWA